MSAARYSALPTSDHPQARTELTPESTAWFWSAHEARSVQVQVISVEPEPEPQLELEEPGALTPPTPQDAVFSNIVPARTDEVEQLERALAEAGFISLGDLAAQRQGGAPPQYYAPPAPSYETVEDPITLASYLFRYGFFFPLFWLVGAFIIISDLQQDPNSLCNVEAQPSSPPKSPYELQLKREEMALLRLAELKWAWRCAYAFAIWFTLFIIALAVVIGTGCIQLF
ncbi:hypothetical protein FRC06_009985 [Ceratobasidium sp. 370]|nr:hypothetical protein FRC06_009985 [Ceratobasidium sp. 370]